MAVLISILGRVGGVSPGVAGAALEHPLERVESNKRKRVRIRGIPPPSHIIK